MKMNCSSDISIFPIKSYMEKKNASEYFNQQNIDGYFY